MKKFVILILYLWILPTSVYAINIDHPDLTEEDAMISERDGATTRSDVPDFDLDHDEIETGERYQNIVPLSNSNVSPIDGSRNISVYIILVILIITTLRLTTLIIKQKNQIKSSNL